MPRTTRKPIHAFPLTGSDEDGHLTTDAVAVICDDGSFFTYSFREGEWHRSASIPGTPGEAEMQAEDAAMDAKMRADLNAAMAKFKNKGKVK